MSNRSLVEFNHDLSFRIKEDPEGFARALGFYLNSGHELHARGLDYFGVRVFGMRRHYDGFKLSWGAITASENAAPDGFQPLDMRRNEAAPEKHGPCSPEQAGAAQRRREKP